MPLPLPPKCESYRSCCAWLLVNKELCVFILHRDPLPGIVLSRRGKDYDHIMIKRAKNLPREIAGQDRGNRQDRQDR